MVIRDLNKIYCEHPHLAIYDNDHRGFEWINNTDGDNSVLSFLRKGDDDSEFLVAVGNFTPVLRKDYRVGVPVLGTWQELLNTDAAEYGGEGFGNCGAVDADEHEWDGRSYSINLTLPPSSMSVFRWSAKSDKKK